MNRVFGWFLAPALACAPLPSWAEEAGTETEFNTIIVTANPTKQRALPDQLLMDSRAIDEIQPMVAADILRGVAGVSLRQNSRGETVVRIRSGEERQTPVFLDGAPLATPWDGRIDLGILPSGIIRQVAVIRSAAPIEYGANAIAGIIDLRTSGGVEGRLLQAELRGGSGNLVDFSALAAAPVGIDTELTLAGTFRTSDFQTIAKRGAIPFDPAENGRRTNTDQNSISLFGAVGYDGGRGRIRLSLLHADAARGIAAEGHIDPAVDSPRYWRYPLWRLSQATVNGDVDLDGGVQLRGVLWHQWFSQNIDSYTDNSYSTLDEREMGRDRTFGGRITLSGPVGDLQWRLSASALSSTHRQIIAQISTGQTPTGQAAALTVSEDLRFRRQYLSAGAELDIPIADDLDLTVGAGIDTSLTPLTGDKPAQPAASAPGLSAIANWQATDALALKASVARRTRFATLREQFGQSLGRFLPNVGLRPEKATTAELAMFWHGSSKINGDVAVWLNDSRDTLGQRVVSVDGRNLRQRYNMRGALSYGLEVSLNLRLSQQLAGELSAAFQHGRSRPVAGSPGPRLVQQVNRQIGFAVDWQPVPAIDLRGEYRHHGRAFDQDETGAFVRLPSADIVNLRAFWTLWKRPDGGSVMVSISAENVTDALLLPQLGLPAQGRSLTAGIKVRFGS